MTGALARVTVLLLVVVVASCGGDVPVSPSPISVTEPPSTTGPAVATPLAGETSSPEDATPPPWNFGDEPQVYEIDPDTGEVTPAEPLGPSTYGEVVDAGIAAGLWEELHGLELVLGYVFGTVPKEMVPGVDSVLTGEISELLERARALTTSGQYSDDDMSGLRRWFELAAPGPDVVESIAAAARPANGTVQVPVGAVVRGASYAAGDRIGEIVAANDCTPIDADEFSSWADFEACYLMYEDVIEGARIRVLYPSWFDGDPIVADLPLRTREALARSAEVFSSLGTVGNIDAVFSLVNPSDSPALATAQLADISGEICGITISPGATTSDDPFENIMAHEAWHCVQRESGYGYPDEADWYVEGGAVYFANLVYPTSAVEAWSRFRFDRNSTTKSLFDMSYEAVVWWQFLGSRESPRAVSDLHLQMALANDRGRSAMKSYGSLFHRFVIEYVAGRIPAPDGGNLPEATKWTHSPESVGKDDTGKEISLDVDSFVAARVIVDYQKELRVLESDASQSDVNVGMVEYASRTSPSEWREVFTDVRTKCDDKVRYVLIGTTEEMKQTATTLLHIDEIEEAVCDPCLLGTWDLDLNSFKSMLTSAMGGGMPTGTDFNLSGHYYISFDEEGVFKEQRDDLTVRASFGGFSMDTVIDSFAHGTYEADGENLTLSNLIDDYVNVSIGEQTFAEDSRILDGTGTYECRTNDLTLTVDSFEPVPWTRVDKILEPPPDV